MKRYNACLFILVQEEVRLGGNVRDQDEDKTCISEIWQHGDFRGPLGLG